MIRVSILLSMAGSPSDISEPTRGSNLPRGGACVYCRRRKMASLKCLYHILCLITRPKKCDGRKPVCSPCERADRTDECEYADSHGLSRADYLEEDIRRIEHRIHELEHPEEVGTSVYLHPSRQRMPNLSQVLESSRPSALGSISATDTWWNSPEPSINMVQNLVDIFIPYASDWGFFLNESRFRRDALIAHPIGHHSRPSPALLTTVYLIAITLSDFPALKAHEATFLSRALSSLPASLSGIHPRKAIHALQAEILLSNYFYASGRFLEGRYHTAAAVSLAVGTVSLRPTTTLRPDADIVEEVERMDACWTTIILDKAWAVATATPSNLQDSSEMFEMVWPEGDTVGSPTSTIAQFLDGTESQTTSMPLKALLAKAVTLWERANRLVVSWKPDMGLGQSDEFLATFTSLDTRITDLQHQIASVEPAPHSPSIRRTVVVGRSIVHAAVIALHGTSAEASMESKDKCLAAAKEILQLATDADLLGSSFIYPILFVRGFIRAFVQSLMPSFCAGNLGGCMRSCCR
ncbi:hypothetical protein B0H12DRAFT_76137 [Mycena haematopus]|nr:hypothetical protein B0H12DRAFT_76137 [Mycena haematopus]